MRLLPTHLLLVFTVILPLHTSAQSANITFRASLKSIENTNLSNVYVRIYHQDEEYAVDSLFSDEAGNIECMLPFSWTGTNSVPSKSAAYGIIAPLSPNIICGATSSVHVEYNYPSRGKLLFTDIQGKKHMNGSLLPPGLYFYFLEFEDGAKSMVNKMLLTERCRVNAELRNQHSGYAVTASESRLKKSSQRDEHFAICNNSFRFSPDALSEAEHCFIEARSTATFTDTANLYLVNNIIQGNGTPSLIKCSNDFSVYANYNAVFGFSSYLGGSGTLIGTSHDITDDPLYLNDDLQIDPTSQAVDQGIGATQFPFIPAVDKNGVARPQGGGYDMGAYEQ